MSTKNLSPVLKTSFVLLAILVLLGIVMLAASLVQNN